MESPRPRIALGGSWDIMMALWLVSSLQRWMGGHYDASNQGCGENEHKWEWVFNALLPDCSSLLGNHIAVKTITLGGLHSRVFSQEWCIDAHALLLVPIITSSIEWGATSCIFWCLHSTHHSIITSSVESGAASCFSMLFLRSSCDYNISWRTGSYVVWC